MLRTRPAKKDSGAVGDLKRALKGLGSAVKEANETAKDVAPERWEQAISCLEGMAEDMTKDMRVCLKCDMPTKGDQRFCPKCGAELPCK